MGKDMKQQQKDADEAESAWREEKELKKKRQKATEYFQHGSQLYKAKDFNGAIQKLSHAITMRPEAARYFYARGNCYLKLEDWERAQMDYTSAIKLDPKLATYYEHRGMALRKMGKYQESLKDYSYAMQLEPDNGSYVYNRGLVFYDLQACTHSTHGTHAQHSAARRSAARTHARCTHARCTHARCTHARCTHSTHSTHYSMIVLYDRSSRSRSRTTRRPPSTSISNSVRTTTAATATASYTGYRSQWPTCRPRCSSTTPTLPATIISVFHTSSSATTPRHRHMSIHMPLRMSTHKSMAPRLQTGCRAFFGGVRGRCAQRRVHQQPRAWTLPRRRV